MSRNFNRKQKQNLFLIADGACQICGDPLGDTWEADHIKSYSKGGETDLINGQALCRKCNRIKGNKEMFKPRKWQMRFIESYSARNQKDFLLVATPGAGKTKATLEVLKGRLDSAINQAVIVVPTEQLKIQWATEALHFGIQLQPYWAGGPIKQGYNGICLTYAQVSTNSQILDWLCQHSPTFVIFDEIHHAGESLAWGIGIKEAFRHAALRLAISGTPFRSDNNKIPFVTYGPNGESCADFSYSYGQALADEEPVCRNVYFPAFDGMASWFDGEDVIESNSFDEALDNPKHESQRLRSILDTGNTFIVSMLSEAAKQLDDIRKDDPTAGGLIVTIDTTHADAIGRLMKEITKEEPTIVHSGGSGENSNHLIGSFDKDISKKWIVAVKMISEGVDIPRLRVGVHATNIVTELSFRQIVGRVVRRQGENDRWAYFFVPKHKTLVEFMERIKEERDHVINDDSREIERNGNGDEVRRDSGFIPVAATHNPDNDIVVAEGETFTQSFAAYALDIMRSAGIQGVNEAQAAIVVSKLQGSNGQQKAAPVSAESPLWVKEKSLRRVVNDRAYAIACRIKERCNTIKTAGEIVKKIHFRWTQLGHNKQENANTEELELKLKWLSSIEDEHWRFI